ncbi:MAG: MFS transporter [Myxococcaceae bacterium]|nr:MFS transporter [Myxococcaceae bacterium]MCI0670922.1 MFS transporter [Myxococcaceae bacterium]
MLKRLVDVREGEGRGLLLSFAFCFAVMCGYAILRPLRDEMAVVGSTRSISLALMFTWTFGAMLVAVPVYSAMVARFPRHRAIPLVYAFFLANLLAFFALMKLGVAPAAVARVFFVWVSVYNLFVVSIFWSFMADLFAGEQGKRLFGFIAAGGTTGMIVGPGLTALLARPLGPVNLLLVSAGFLLLALGLVLELTRWAHGQLQARPARGPDPEAPVGGTVFAGFRLLVRSPLLLAMGTQTLLYAATSTFLYFQQQKLVAAAAADATQRLELFAHMDMAVQGLTLLLQTGVTGRLLQRAGLAVALAVVPVVTGLGFLGLATAHSLVLLTVFRSLRSATHYAFERPSREVLFTAVDREQKYKAKSFIDTALYRGSDLAGGWLYTGLGALGLGLSGVALAAIPLAAAWLGTSLYLARRHASEAAGHGSPDLALVPPPAAEAGPASRAL